MANSTAKKPAAKTQKKKPALAGQMSLFGFAA